MAPARTKPRSNRNRLAWLTALALIALAVFSSCATRAGAAGARCDDSTRPGETELRLYPGVIVTSRIVGTVNPVDGEGWLAENQPTLEIWPHHDSAARVSHAVGLDDGRLEAIDLPPGDYCFRAHAAGFSGVVGKLRVVKSEEAHPLDLRLPLAF